MDERELLDLMVTERIDQLYRQKQSLNKTEPELPFIKKAEAILGQLPKEERDVLNQYMEHQTLQLADLEPYLYSCGVSDGIRIMKYIQQL